MFLSPIFLKHSAELKGVKLIVSCKLFVLTTERRRDIHSNNYNCTTSVAVAAEETDGEKSQNGLKKKNRMNVTILLQVASLSQCHCLKCFVRLSDHMTTSKLLGSHFQKTKKNTLKRGIPYLALTQIPDWRLNQISQSTVFLVCKIRAILVSTLELLH